MVINDVDGISRSRLSLLGIELSLVTALKVNKAI